MTRHLDFELKQIDWDVMILHYLGLDHVGHMEGPFAPYNIRRKLHEMDEVIRKIYSGLNDEDLFLILSDHGMANEGGHGGSSHMEVRTPSLFASKSYGESKELLSGFDFKNFMRNVPTREQIDLVSTLCCLFDLSVPEHNRGVNFIKELIRVNSVKFENELSSLNCLVGNLNQLNRKFTIVKSELNAKIVQEIKEKLVEMTDKRDEELKLELLVKLNEKLELFLRDCTHNLDTDKTKAKEQKYALALSLMFIFYVSFEMKLFI